MKAYIAYAAMGIGGAFTGILLIPTGILAVMIYTIWTIPLMHSKTRICLIFYVIPEPSDSSLVKPNGEFCPLRHSVFRFNCTVLNGNDLSCQS